MKTTLTVDLGLDPAHAPPPLLKARCSLDGRDGAPRGPAQRVFEVEVTAGQTLTLAITVPSAAGTAPDRLAVVQVLAVGDGLALSGQASSNGKGEAAGAPDPARPLHPRLTVTHAAPPYALAVDLAFVDVTAELDARNLLSDYRDPFYQVDGLSELSPDDLHHGCRLHVLELAAGTPRAWSVVVPAAVTPDRDRADVLVFFQPTLLVEENRTHPYTSALDCSGYLAPNLPRYTRDPPAWGPSYYQLRTDGSFFRVPYPYTGFEGQLAASGRPVLLVMPYPYGADMDYGQAIRGGLDRLLGSLLRALHGDGSIGAAAPGPVTLGRVGVGGYSAGSLGAIRAFEANRALVEEMYLFDPLSVPTTRDVATWLTAGGSSPGHRLCLVAGQHVDLCFKARAALAAFSPAVAAQISITPADPGFYDTAGTPWHAALFLPGKRPDSGMLALSPTGAEPLSDLSAQSGVTVAGTSPVAVAVQVGGAVVRREVACTGIDAAGLVRLWQVSTDGAAPGAQRVSTAAALDVLANGPRVGPWDVGTGVLHDMRHQWAVGGGSGSPARYPYGEQDATAPDGSAFEGQLHFCLKGSGFA